MIAEAEDVGETELKAALVALLRLELPDYVIQRHEDRWTGGIPDISVNGNKKTSWWEAKHADPTWSRDGRQEIKMKRLARAAHHVRYIIWQEDPKDLTTRRTLIVQPRHINEWTTGWESVTKGFDHRWLLEAIRRVHS